MGEGSYMSQVWWWMVDVARERERDISSDIRDDDDL